VAGQRAEGVDGCRRIGAGQQQRHPRLQSREERLVQLALAGAGALLRRQRLVLEGLQLRRDVALGVLQRLPPPVVVRHLGGLAVRHLDVEAVHAVVLDAQVRDARARALARFEVEQEGAGVVAQCAQLVEFSVEAGGDHVAVAWREGGLGEQRARELVVEAGRRRSAQRQLLRERRRQGGGQRCRAIELR
jgi:hypothetical protein